MNGYWGRYLAFDTGSGQREVFPLPEAEARRWIGGPGLAVRWLLRHSPPGVDPMGPDNPLVLATCPLVDTGVTTTSRMAVAARSPQTGLLGESLISSRIAVALRRSGWDGVVLTGRARVLSVFCLDGDRAWVEPAPDLAGLPAAEAERRLRDRLDRGFEVAAIGPAGEHGVVYATISHDGRHAGRTGMGAVLGAHGLKAVAIRGERRPVVHDPGTLAGAAERLRARSLGPDTAKYRITGTAGNLLTFDRLGILPARNFRSTGSPLAASLTGERLAGAPRERHGCAGCTIGCEHRFLTPGGVAVRGEYESLFALGPLLGLEDPASVLELVACCDELGMDTLSFGGTVAWAMECFERGVLTAATCGGRVLRFGDAAAVRTAAGLAARRQEPLGELLALGSRAAAERVGGGSEAWAMHTKGLELPGYEPRALRTLALGLAVGARGACHNRSGAYDRDLESGAARVGPDDGRAAGAVESEDRAALQDALALCKFLRRCFEDLPTEAAGLLAAVTDWDVTGDELERSAARIVALKRLYNQREGADRNDDTLPPRLLAEPVEAGPATGARITAGELDRMLDDYYQLRGWDERGRVPESLAAELLAE